MSRSAKLKMNPEPVVATAQQLRSVSYSDRQREMDLLCLLHHRGQVEMNSMALSAVAGIFLWAGLPRDMVAAKIDQLAGDADLAAVAIGKCDALGRRQSTEDIVNILGITAEEAQRMGLLQLVPGHETDRARRDRTKKARRDFLEKLAQHFTSNPNLSIRKRAQALNITPEKLRQGVVAIKRQQEEGVMSFSIKFPSSAKEEAI